MAIIHRVRAVSQGWAGGPGLTTCYFREGGGSVADAAVAQLGADRVRAAFQTMVGSFPNGHTVTVDPSVDAINDTNGDLVASFGVTPPAPTVGLSGAGYQVIAAMLLVSYRTNGVVNGHRVAGRTFLGPVDGEQDTNGTPNAQQLARAAQFGAALLDKGLTGPDLVIWARPFAGRTTPPPVLPSRLGSSHVVTSIGVRDFYAVLRSRRD